MWISICDCSSSKIPNGIPLLLESEVSLYLMISLLLACLSLKLFQSEFTSFLSLAVSPMLTGRILRSPASLMMPPLGFFKVSPPFYSIIGTASGDLCCLCMHSRLITSTPFFFLFLSSYLFFLSEVSWRDAVRPRSYAELSQSIG